MASPRHQGFWSQEGAESWQWAGNGVREVGATEIHVTLFRYCFVQKLLFLLFVVVVVIVVMVPLPWLLADVHSSQKVRDRKLRWDGKMVQSSLCATIQSGSAPRVFPTNQGLSSLVDTNKQHQSFGRYKDINKLWLTLVYDYYILST